MRPLPRGFLLQLLSHSAYISHLLQMFWEGHFEKAGSSVLEVISGLRKRVNGGFKSSLNNSCLFMFKLQLVYITRTRLSLT